MKNELKEEYYVGGNGYLWSDKRFDEENQRLKKQLDIREKMIYDEDAQSFTLPDNSDVHYCSVCYAHDGKMIPMANNTERGYLCRICEEVWMKGIPRK